MKWPRTIACIALTPLLIGAAAAQTVSIVTTPAGTYTNSATAAVAKMVGEKSKVRAVVQAQALQAFIPVAAGNGEFGMGNAFDASFFVNGTAEYEGQGPHRSLRTVAALLPYQVAMAVRADSDIKTLADLKGKRVNAGFNAQKTIARLTEAELANAGLSYKDVVEVLTPNIIRSAEDFIAGKVDVLFFSLGAAAVKLASATVGGIRVLPIDDSPAALKRMQDMLPGVYVTEILPSPAYDGITRPTKVIAFDMMMFTNDSVPDQVVYEVTKAVHQNKAGLAATFAPFRLFDPDHMAKSVKDVEFHPGALKYYREIGLLPKS